MPHPLACLIKHSPPEIWLSGRTYSAYPFHTISVLNSSPIASSPDELGGALVFTGTRVPVQTLLDYLNDGFLLAQFLEFFPSVARTDAEEFLRMLGSKQK